MKSRPRVQVILLSTIFCSLISWSRGDLANGQQSATIAGVNVIPHQVEETLRFRRPRDPALAARVQLFVRGSAVPERFDGKTPAELLQSGQWAWHDLHTAVKAPADSLTVWTFNGKSSRWGVGEQFQVEGAGIPDTTIHIERSLGRILSVTFLSSDGHFQPDTLCLHVANDTTQDLQLSGVRLWLPENGASWQILQPRSPLPIQVGIAPHSRGVVKLKTERLPLTYAAVELQTADGSLWAHLRIKREVFDISGGWVNETLTEEPYLRLLRHLHVNTGQIDHIDGYTDNPALYERYPIKLFNRLWPLEKWDTDEWLPKIHAVEFIGEPQFGGGKPMSPQEVFDQLLPYRISRLPTSVTLSDERTWRWYAGLSDYPHYDAYRVVAPAADAWGAYDRWDGRRITWGAPLETIGDMSRNLRELSRPAPVAYWSQGPHDGWGGGLFRGGRKRRSPTPDELRSQAMHALAARITSLYWFNLSLKSLLKFPDTWEPMQRLGREIRMLEPFYLEGDAYDFQRISRDGKPDWELSTLAAPTAAVLFAIDTAYTADEQENVFQFGPPRPAQFSFKLPHWLLGPKDVFRVDAEGIHEIQWQPTPDGVRINDLQQLDAIYIATSHASLRDEIEQRRQTALAVEAANPIDHEALRSLMK
jgi:hypothetical protein